MLALLSKIFNINCIQVIGVFQDANNEVYSLLTFKKTKDKLDSIDSRSFNTIENLLEVIDTKLPVVLAVDGKGVLNKKVDQTNEVDLAWQKNIDFSTIYYTNYIFNNFTFMSFCRKNVVEEWLEKFENKKIQILSIYIGSFLSTLLVETINEERIVSGNLNLVLEQNKLVDFNKLETIPDKKYKVSENLVTNYTLPLYGIALHYFVKNESVTLSKRKTDSIDEIIYKKAFSFFGILMLVLFLVSLLLSYMGIQYYASKNAELNIQNVYFNKAYQQIISLEEQKKDKEKIIHDSGFLSDKFLSFYAYEIISSTPNTLSLDELNIAPLQKLVKHNEKVEITPGTLIVKGVTIDEEEFNSWLRDLKKMNWIAKFELESLKKDKKNNTQFSLKIRIK